jgi:hypothetical protein
MAHRLTEWKAVFAELLPILSDIVPRYRLVIPLPRIERGSVIGGKSKGISQQ